MSFLNQLKSQASALQSEKEAQNSRFESNAQVTESAAKSVGLYVAELAKQLNVIAPAGPRLTLDGKTPWPAMKMLDFRSDARKKMLRDREVFDYIGMGWSLLPVFGQPVGGSVSANFPPDLQRIEERLSAGGVKHERVSVRHPEKNTLQLVRFDYTTQARGSLTITPDHDAGKLNFRLANVQGFGVVNVSYPVERVQTALLDEMAKMLMGQPSAFV
jgi:hypothetical protein